MTHPLTPREKVAPSLKDLLRQAVETMKSWTPEQREAHFEAQKKAWVAAEMAFGDEGTRVVTALASGSGDHAELASLMRLTKRLRGIAFDYIGKADRTTCIETEAANAIEFLLAENAALRAERDEARTLVGWANNSLFGSHNYFHSTNGGPFDPHHLDRAIERLKSDSRRATEAERKLAESYDWIRKQDCECDPAWSTRQCGRCTFLSKEAERG